MSVGLKIEAGGEGGESYVCVIAHEKDCLAGPLSGITRVSSSACLDSDI